MNFVIILFVIGSACILCTFLLQLSLLQSRTVATLGQKNVSFAIPSWGNCFLSFIKVALMSAVGAEIIESIFSSFPPHILLQVLALFFKTAFFGMVVWFVYHNDYKVPSKIAVLAAINFVIYGKLVSVLLVWLLKQFS